MSGVVFEQSYVAYLDILGFSEIVTRVSNNPESDDLQRLFKCHQQGAGVIGKNPLYRLVQFSDSIVISRPYAPEHFVEFIATVAAYQRMLLAEGFMCRGGVSRGNHYSNGTFMMSAGLVSAYNIEVSQARFPRVAISVDLLKLVGEGYVQQAQVLREDDGVFFVDFLVGVPARESKKLEGRVRVCVEECKNHSSVSVREKGFWLASYCNKKLATKFRRNQFKIPVWKELSGMGE